MTTSYQTLTVDRLAKSTGTETDALSRTPHTFTLLGVEIDNATMSDAIDGIISAANGGLRATYAFVNADCLNRAAEDSHYRAILARSTQVFADGSGVALAMRFRGQKVVENVNGTDMFPLLCNAAAEHGLSLFLLGGAPGIACQAAANMCEANPALDIAGTHHGYLDEAEEQRVVDRINDSGASILLVGMGCPIQEKWIARNRHRLAPGAVIGVGGLFDFYSGRIPRAPIALRSVGLEWTWRLAQEPARMWRRYILGNPVFLARCVREQISQPRKPAPKSSPERPSALASALGLMTRLSWRLRRPLRSFGKRTVDVAGATIGLALLSPLLVVVAAAIRLESKGPVLFAQTRVGAGGKRFTIWKFRSMYIDAEARRQQLLAHSDRNGSHFKMRRDPRITRIGRFIRRASIDELPQLWNVLNGTMSLVGPRPNLESEVAKYRFDEYMRLDAKPGITCIWQVSGRAEIPWERQVEMDLDYIYQPSIASDFRLLAATIPAIVFGRGAY